LGKAFRWLPAGLARDLGAGLGRILFILVWPERRRTVAHLAAAFPEKPLAWAKAMAREVFAYWGRAAVDFFRLAALSPQALDALVADVRGLEHLLEGADRGVGVVVVVPHLGHWELMGHWTASRRPLAVVARQLFDQRMDQALLAHRAGGGIRIFPRNTSVIPILRWLKEGKALGALADQDTGVDSLFCEFFGRPAKTPTGAVLLAQATEARLITGSCWRQADGRYVIEFEGAIPVPARGERDPLAFWPAAQEYTRRIEAAIRRHPEQWVWMHRRWKSRPDEDSSGWQKRHAQACMDRIAQWVAAGRPELKA
jgi:KDO2-lipid IV(A) lauroyltransferase